MSVTVEIPVWFVFKVNWKPEPVPPTSAASKRRTSPIE